MSHIFKVGSTFKQVACPADAADNEAMDLNPGPLASKQNQYDEKESPHNE